MAAWFTGYQGGKAIMAELWRDVNAHGSGEITRFS